ncbi:hypothetical protein DFH27DRAFT_575641 [Peziza echinospora]|nr:hypothetical protein DFH27DRAFT_575641 [Peziza echinospora]
MMRGVIIRSTFGPNMPPKTRTIEEPGDEEAGPTSEELDELEAAMARLDVTKSGWSPLPPAFSLDAANTSVEAIPSTGSSARKLRSGKVYTSTSPAHDKQASSATTVLSLFENLLLTAPPASDSIFHHLSLVHSTILASCSRFLWHFIYGHPYVWQTFNLRPFTATSLYDRRLRTFPQHMYLKNVLQKRQQYDHWRAGELMDYLIKDSKNHSGVGYILGDGAANLTTEQVGEIACKILGRVADVGIISYPRHIIVENKWLSKVDMQSVLARFIVSKHGLETLEVNILPAAGEKWTYLAMPKDSPVATARYLGVLSAFLKGVGEKMVEGPAGSGLGKLIINYNSYYFVPEMKRTPFHRPPKALLPSHPPALRDLMEILLWCQSKNVSINIGLCKSCAPEVTAADVIAMVDGPEPLNLEKLNPVWEWESGKKEWLEVGEVPDGGRECDDCGLFEKDPACEKCLKRRTCATCGKYSCIPCDESLIERLRARIRQKEQDEGEGDEDEDDEDAPSSISEYEPDECNMCHRKVDAENLPKCCICNNIWRSTLVCYLCKQSMCDPCGYKLQYAARRNCRSCRNLIDQYVWFYPSFLHIYALSFQIHPRLTFIPHSASPILSPRYSHWGMRVGHPDCGNHSSRNCENCPNVLCTPCRASTHLIDHKNRSYTTAHYSFLESAISRRASMPSGTMMPKNCTKCRQWFCGECKPECTCEPVDGSGTEVTGEEDCVVHNGETPFCRKCGYILAEFGPRNPNFEEWPGSSEEEGWGEGEGEEEWVDEGWEDEDAVEEVLVAEGEGEGDEYEDADGDEDVEDEGDAGEDGDGEGEWEEDT